MSHWSDGLNPSKGDLVETGDGYIAVVLRVLPDRQLELFLGNGLRVTESGPVKMIPFHRECTGPCNFLEVLKFRGLN